MPRKKKTTSAKQSRVRARIKNKRVIEESKKSRIRWGESYTSLLLGVVVVIIAVLFIGSIVKVKHQQETSSISITAVPTNVQLKETEKTPTQVNTRKTYTVAPGDTLWSISERFYNSGFFWKDVADANNIQNADFISEGEVLAIPSITPSPTVTTEPTPQQPTQNPSAITQDSYTVKPGDTLWDISVRAYADGYRWVDIVKANNLENPDLIFSGNILKIPR